MQVTGSRPTPAGIIVKSQIIRPDAPPIQVDWQLGVESGLYKVSDVIVDGVSMAVSERATFAQQIAANGGQVTGLLAHMREATFADAPPGVPYPAAGSPYPAAGVPYQPAAPAPPIR
ncbi:MAG: ABC transporter substrate-binding protein [Alphaproteobacteria bacterium]|nr:ABC transporter substrate-binding protein [Alphaproteobacteria bacterium]